MRFIGISGQDDLPEMQKFVEEYGMSGFEHVADVRGEIWAAFEVSAQPSYVFVNDDGTLQRQIGALEEDELRAVLETLTAS